MLIPHLKILLSPYGPTPCALPHDTCQRPSQATTIPSCVSVVRKASPADRFPHSTLQRAGGGDSRGGGRCQEPATGHDSLSTPRQPLPLLPRPASYLAAPGGRPGEAGDGPAAPGGTSAATARRAGRRPPGLLPARPDRDAATHPSGVLVLAPPEILCAVGRLPRPPPPSPSDDDPVRRADSGGFR